MPIRQSATALRSSAGLMRKTLTNRSWAQTAARSQIRKSANCWSGSPVPRAGHHRVQCLSTLRPGLEMARRSGLWRYRRRCIRSVSGVSWMVLSFWLAPADVLLNSEDPGIGGRANLIARRHPAWSRLSCRCRRWAADKQNRPCHQRRWLHLPLATGISCTSQVQAVAPVLGSCSCTLVQRRFRRPAPGAAAWPRAGCPSRPRSA